MAIVNHSFDHQLEGQYKSDDAPQTKTRWTAKTSPFFPRLPHVCVAHLLRGYRVEDY